MYIQRHMEETVEKLSKMFGAVLVSGPRGGEDYHAAGNDRGCGIRDPGRSLAVDQRHRDRNHIF